MTKTFHFFYYSRYLEKEFNLFSLPSTQYSWISNYLCIFWVSAAESGHKHLFLSLAAMKNATDS